MKRLAKTLFLVNTLQYENAIYEPSIKSVQLHPLRFELGNPLIHLSFKDSLLLSFDDLSNDPQNYAYIPLFIVMLTGRLPTSWKVNT